MNMMMRQLFRSLLFLCRYLFDSLTLDSNSAEGSNIIPSQSQDTLKLIHVVFRHGNRTQSRSYPTDPYRNKTFYPIGKGHLTNAGKRQEYNIGVYLRKTYNIFLPNLYSPGVVQARSSFIARCRESLQLVLAGLFPPTESQIWSTDLNWQPISYDYVAVSEDKLFFSTYYCKKYDAYFRKYRTLSVYQDIFKPYEETMTYIQNKSGIIPTVPNTSLMLYTTLRSQFELGLALPDWTDSIWPEPLSTITKLEWQQQYRTEEMRALGAGFLLSKIINDTLLTINEDPSVADLKISLYSGHDYTVAAVLSWLGITDFNIPDYGAFVIFEIHIINDIPIIKVIHQNYQYETPLQIEIPNCGFECRFKTFVQLYAQYTNPYNMCT